MRGNSGIAVEANVLLSLGGILLVTRRVINFICEASIRLTCLYRRWAGGAALSEIRHGACCEFRIRVSRPFDAILSESIRFVCVHSCLCRRWSLRLQDLSILTKCPDYYAPMTVLCRSWAASLLSIPTGLDIGNGA